MKIIETKGRIAKDGSIILPPGVLESMGVEAGDTVHLAYLSHHPVKQLNSYGEFFISKEGIDHVSEPVEAPESAELSVPHALLEAAGISLDDPHRLFVFEAPIDLLSYISLNPANWKQHSFVALNGVSEKPVLKLLELYPQLDRVVLCLDNDEAGLNAASRIHKTLREQGFEDVVYDVPAHKDWNDDLKAAYSQEQITPAMVMR